MTTKDASLAKKTNKKTPLYISLLNIFWMNKWLAKYD